MSATQHPYGENVRYDVAKPVKFGHFPPDAHGYIPACEVGAQGDGKANDAEGSILTEAHGLVHGPRQQSYGHPAEDFSRTARLASVLLAPSLTMALTATDIALIMVCVKLSREANGHKRDNLVDAAGYLETLAMIREGR